MTIAVGDRIPDMKLAVPSPEGPQPVQTGELLGKGKVVLFAVPGAFTPTCSDYHLPGFVQRADELKAKGVDQVVCLAVNDAFVLQAWGAAHDVDGKVVLLADGSGALTKQLGLELDLTAGGLGVRSRRYAAILEDGVVKELLLEEGPGLENSSADKVLAKL